MLDSAYRSSGDDIRLQHLRIDYSFDRRSGVNVTASASNGRPGESVNYSATPINLLKPDDLEIRHASVYGLVIDVPACTTIPVYYAAQTGRMQVCMIDEDDIAICDESPLVTVAP
jgi:hypothetical protein